MDWLDDKYDLGYLDELLGGDDTDTSTVTKVPAENSDRMINYCILLAIIYLFEFVSRS